MADGVRLFHETARGGTVTVEHPTKRYKEPYLCGPCKKVHKNKTIHLNVDATGYTIVAPQVLKLLRDAGLPSLTIVNTVTTPPPQRVSVDGQGLKGAFAILEHEATGGKFFVLKNRLFKPRLKKE